MKGFESCENTIKRGIVESSLRSKMALRYAVPMIDDALQHITNYAGTLLREESTFSLAYVCVEKNQTLFEVKSQRLPWNSPSS
jgi:hypothetical protein